MNIHQEVGGDGGGGGGEGNNQSHQLQPPQPQPPPPPPQRCPRCDSVNTKFCYYNNYSLSQPRYFCKTCKRYWTHGGSLRNIPIGGGCRKGKRTKTSSSGSSSSSSAALKLMSQSPQLQPRLQDVIPTPPNSMTSPASRVVIGRSPAAAPAVPSVTSFCQGGGYLSSPATIYSQNPLFNLSSLNVAPSSNLGLHHHPWFNAPSSLASESHIPPSSSSSPMFQSANRSREVESESLYASDHNHQGLVETSMDTMMSNSSYASLHDWSQNSLWSTVSTTSIGGISESPSNIDNNADKAGGSSSLCGNQLPDLPGYGPPP